MKIGATEIILLLLLALIIFGGRKLTGIGKALGTSIRDFKREVSADDKGEAKVDKDDATANANAPANTNDAANTNASASSNTEEGS